jgi:biotin carboxyl carrier protein
MSAAARHCDAPTNRSTAVKYIATVADKQFEIAINGDNSVLIDGNPVNADLKTFRDGTLHSLLVDGRSHAVRVQLVDDEYQVQIGGEMHNVQVKDERAHRLAGLRGEMGDNSGEIVIRAPMPGVIIEIPVKPGQEVKKGDTLIVLESMKMHNEFSAPRDGTVHGIRVEKGHKIEKNTVMITLT